MFRSIDKSNLGFIDFDNLSYFIQNNQYNIEAESLAKFLKRISRNEELRLPKREFCNFLMLPGYYKSSNHTPLRNIDEKSIGIIKENTSKNIENYEKTQSNIQGNFCNPHQISLNKGKYYDQNENPLENNTLRLETADFQYSDNADDQKSLASIYESPIYKQHCYSKNKDIPLAYLDSQESLLELKNELINTNLKINNDSKNINNYIENKENEVSRTKNRYGGFKKNGFALKERNLNEENTHSLNKNWSNDENNEKLMIFRKKSEEDEFSDRNLNFYTFNKHKSFKEEKFKDFFDYFEEILRLEKKTEKLKQDLALRPDFNLLDFFVIFDKNQKGYLTFEEIVIMFSDLKIKVSEEEIKLFLKKFDKSNFGKLKYDFYILNNNLKENNNYFFLLDFLIFLKL